MFHDVRFRLSSIFLWLKIMLVFFASLRNWHITRKFKVYNVLNWYIYIYLKMIITVRLIPSFAHITAFLFFLVITFKIYSLNLFKYIIKYLLIIITILYNQMPRTYSSHSWKVFTLQPTSPDFPQPPALGNHHSFYYLFLGIWLF